MNGADLEPFAKDGKVIVLYLPAAPQVNTLFCLVTDLQAATKGVRQVLVVCTARARHAVSRYSRRSMGNSSCDCRPGCTEMSPESGR